MPTPGPLLALEQKLASWMGVVQTIMLAKAPYTSLRDAISAHPIMAEGLTALFAAVPARARAHTAESLRGEYDGDAAA